MINLLNSYLASCYKNQQIPSFGHFINYFVVAEEKKDKNNEHTWTFQWEGKEHKLQNLQGVFQALLDKEKEGTYELYYQKFEQAKIEIYQNTGNGSVVADALKNSGQGEKVQVVIPNDLLHKEILNSPEVKDLLTDEIKNAMKMAQDRIFKGLGDEAKKQLVIDWSE